jgi:hypothetical protein
MVEGHGPFPEPTRERSTRALAPTPRPKRRVWPLAVALLILTGSLVVDVGALLLAREVARQAEVLDQLP